MISDRREKINALLRRQFGDSKRIPASVANEFRRALLDRLLKATLAELSPDGSGADAAEALDAALNKEVGQAPALEPDEAGK